MTYRAPLIVNAGASQIQELAVADGLSVAGNVLTSVILANTYLYGNGQPFNGSGGAGSFIASGNSNVIITQPDGPVNTSVSGVGIVTVNSVGQYVTGIAYASTAVQAPLISASGNIAAGGYVLGNGALLTGVITSVANINNGTSNVTIESANANVTFGVAGTANVVTITPTTLIVASSSGNVISTEGNVSVGYVYGNGSLLTGITTTSNTIFNGNSNVSVSSANANVTISVSTVANVVSISPTTVSVAGNIAVGNVSISGNIATGNSSVSGNIAVGNISVSGNIIGNAQSGPSSATAVGYMSLPVNSQAGNSSYTLALTDQGRLIYSNVAMTLTVPLNATVAFPVGAVVALAQYGTGTMSIVATSGVTIAFVGTSFVGNRTLSSAGMASLTQVATNTWLASGTNLS